MEQNQNDAVSIYRKIAADEAPPYGLVKLGPEDKLFTKPTLLCCGGAKVNDTRKDSEKMANGFAKVGHALLGYNETVGKNDPLDIVSLSYPQMDTALSKNISEYTSKRLKGHEAAATRFAQGFAQQHLFPLIEDADGKAKNLAAIKKGLRNVTVLTHSYGALFIQQAGNVLVDHMKELGMKEADIRDATSQVVVVSAGPTVPPAGGKASFTTFNVMNIHDKALRDYSDMQTMVMEMMAISPAARSLLVDDNNAPVSRERPRTPLERLRSGREYFVKTLNIVPVTLKQGDGASELAITPGSNEFIVTASPPLWVNGIKRIVEKPTHNNYGTAKDVRAGEGTTDFLPWDQTGHEPASYFNYNLEKDGKLTQDGHTLRTLISCALTNSISNAIANASGSEPAPLPPVQDLLKLPEKTPYAMAADVDFIKGMRARGYNEKMQDALLQIGKQQASKGR